LPAPVCAFTDSWESAFDLGLGKGKLLHDKREDIKARDAALEMRRAMGHRREG